MTETPEPEPFTDVELDEVRSAVDTLRAFNGGRVVAYVHPDDEAHMPANLRSEFDRLGVPLRES